MAITPIEIIDKPKDCSECALCCLYEPIPPFIDEELRVLRMDLRAGIERYKMATWYRDKQACLWLDKEAGTCKNYDHRPAVCQKFNRGEEQCLQLRSDFKNVELLREIINGEQTIPTHPPTNQTKLPPNVVN